MTRSIATLKSRRCFGLIRGGSHGRIHSVKVIVVTGGIASGKSTVVEMLREMGGEGVAVFDCDKAVAELHASGKLSRDLVAAFGSEALDEQGAVNKEFLRQIIWSDPAGKAQLESIIHPKLMQKCIKAISEARQSDACHTFLADIPLYYESHTESLPVDKVCTVALTRESQMKRLLARDAFSPEVAEGIINAQSRMQDKVDPADYVLWNEGNLEQLRAQVGYIYRSEIEREAKALRARSLVADMNELRAKSFQDLQKLATSASAKGVSGNMTRRQIVAGLAQVYLSEGGQVYASGVIDYNRVGKQYLLRDAMNSFRPGEDDVIIPPELMNAHQLRIGNSIKVKVRLAKKDQLVAAEVMEIEGITAADFKQKKEFDQLTALIPTKRLILENMDIKSPAPRLLDLVAPLGMGQRALVVAPPRGGKTVLLKTIAKSLRANYPEAQLLILLLDERPEEVTDFEETVDAPVYASTFDENSRRHEQLSDIVLERARRLVEQGKDVIVLLDSLTRLARGYNAHATGGRTMSGGLDSQAMEKPRKFFGAARNVEEGGSLTIIATCLVDTESRMDEIIFEEFKGTGNMEIRLDRELSERRIYPAISLPQSGTRNDDRLYHPDEFARVLQLRRQLATHPGWEALELLLRNIQKTQNNAELLLRGLIG